jgi:hypothetical protein
MSQTGKMSQYKKTTSMKQTGKNVTGIKDDDDDQIVY